MSKIILTVIVLCCSITAIAQEPVSQMRATEGKISYAKTQSMAAQIQLPYAAEVVAGAIRDYAKKNGGSVSRSKGFLVISGSGMGTGEIKDLYFKVQKSGSRNAEGSVVSLITAEPGQNIGAAGVENSAQVEKGKSILENLVPSIETFNHSVATGNQQQAVRQAEKTLENLQRDQRFIENQIRKLQSRLNENKKKQNEQEQEIERQRKALQDMRTE